MTKKKNILIISYSPLHRDPRILRQIQALKDDYKIQTVGWTNPNVKDVDFFEVSMPTACKSFGQKVLKGLQIVFHFYKKVLINTLSINQLCSYEYIEPSAIFANDWNGLYAAKVLVDKYKWNCKVYFDSHEYFPLYRENLKWKIFEKPVIKYALSVCKKYISVMSCVCPTLSRMYEKYFGFEDGFVKVITNSPNFEPQLQPSPVGDKIRMIHHGGAMRARNLELMIDMMAFLPPDKYELNFMLVNNEPEYFSELKEKAGKYNNIHFFDPVSFSEIPKFINKFDIGLFILNNDIITYKYALPNKFFEFVQARLAIAVGDSSEMRDYVEKFQLGVSAKSNNPKDMADVIQKISNNDIMLYKQNSHMFAEELSANNNILQLRKIAEELTYV